MAWIAQVQKDAPPSYAVTPSGTDGYRAAHPERTLAAKFSRDGATVAGTDGRVGLRLARYGFAGAMHEASAEPPQVRNNRVEYSHGPALSEWYLHGPLGLEHGFTVTAPPEGHRSDELVLEMEVLGTATPKLSSATSAVLATGPSAKIHYRDLYAMDATAKLLGAHMTVDGSRLAIHVDAREAKYPLTIDPLIWIEEAKLVASDAAADDNFGAAVAISGDTAIVGAPFDFRDGAILGASYIFVRSGATWLEQQKLTASAPFPGSKFGSAVAISGDTAIVGARDHSNNGGIALVGATYVFVRTGTVWSELQTLDPSDPDHDDRFGAAVAMSADTAIVGAPGDNDGGSNSGSVYVFVRTGGTWAQQQKLSASDPTADKSLGASVALSADTAVVGAPVDSVGAAFSGSAYVFVRSGTTWTQQQKLFASDGGGSDRFGGGVAIDGDTVIVGAPKDNLDSGSAYVFARSGTVWSEEQKLVSSNPINGSEFGGSVAIVGNQTLIGAHEDDNLGINDGLAYVFERVATTWSERQRLAASDGDGFDSFGSSVAISATSLIVGAMFDGDLGANAGSAYIFSAQEDTDDDGIVDSNDNCPLISNPTQADLDGDDIGDPCDSDDNDLDDDGVVDGNDNCPNVTNANQSDIDLDGFGDVCDDDDDGDEIVDTSDNCPVDANADQSDVDADDVGDVCDPDIDGDGIANAADNCPLVANPDQADVDTDGDGDVCDGDADGDGLTDLNDNCPLVPNLNQADLDSDDIGDVCDADDDGDGVADAVDNCPRDANADQNDADSDDVGDICDNDDDSDGVVDADDNCSLVSNASQADLDEDDIGDVCDDDDDGDGILDVFDNCPLAFNDDQSNTDDDSEGNACDNDDDNDGIPDASDNCPLVVNPGQSDIDGNDAGDACDGDQDGDDHIDEEDNCPLTANPAQDDVDGDSIGDACDDDNDNDGILDNVDNCRLKPNQGQQDGDGNGIGDVCQADANSVQTFYGCSVGSGIDGHSRALLWLLALGVLLRRRRRILD